MGEAIRKMEDPLPSRKPPRLFWVYVGLVMLALIYLLSKNGGGTPKFDIKRAAQEQQVEDARKNLEEAEATYRRLLRQDETPH